MNLITGRAGAAHITPRQDAMWHQGLIEMESCIFDAYENFAAEIITNNEVRIRSGVGMLQGRFFCIEPNTYDSAEIANGNQGEERIDLIVARIAVDASANTQSASIEVIQGTPAAENPTTPEAITGDLDAGDLIADYPLAVVRISGINITSVENTFNAGWLSLPQTRQNINYMGARPISNTANDTPAKWAALGTGVSYYNVAGCLVEQPTTYGILHNMATNGESVTQIWISLVSSVKPVICMRQGSGSSWTYNWYELKAVVSRNTNYPVYTDNWRWEKYSDGTFRAEYKENITTGALSESSAIGNLMYYNYSVDLPFTATALDVVKWGHTDNSGIIFVQSQGNQSNSSVKARIMRAVQGTGAITLTVGCTVTGRWD